MTDPSIRWSTPLSLRVHAETVLGVQSGAVENGRSLVVEGNLHLPELRAEIEFFAADGNGNGNGHAGELRATAVIVPRNYTMTVPVQRLVPPAPDRKDVWASTHALDQDPPWTERYAGRLGDGLLTFDQYITVDPTLDITFTRREGANGAGVELEFAGELRFDRPSSMRLQFRCSKQSTMPASGSVEHEAMLMLAGARILIPRQVVPRRVSHNPWKSVRVIEAGGRVLAVGSGFPAGGASTKSLPQQAQRIA